MQTLNFERTKRGIFFIFQIISTTTFIERKNASFEPFRNNQTPLELRI